MTKFVGLFTAMLLVLLGTQAEPITGTIAFVWAALHLIAVYRDWYVNQD